MQNLEKDIWKLKSIFFLFVRIEEEEMIVIYQIDIIVICSRNVFPLKTLNTFYWYSFERLF
jgi:hypothetical protein